MKSFLAEATNRVQSLQEQAATAARRLNMQEALLVAMDQRPEISGELSIYVYPWENSLSCTLYYTLPALPDILPVLEWAERCFGGEFTSNDTDAGARYFELSNDSLGLTLSIYVTPDEEAPEGTCKKVLVGVDVETQTIKTNKYKLVCR